MREARQLIVAIYLCYDW